MTDGPLGILAELTHACPLACSYCSNPLELTKRSDELGTDDWRASSTRPPSWAAPVPPLGREPLLRRDVVDLVAHASGLGMYTNLVTSAIGLSRPRAEALREAGLDHVQVHPGRPGRALRPPGRHLLVRQEDRGRPPGQGAGLAADPQRRAAPAEHRPDRGDPRLGHRAGSRPRRAGQHPVLRLGPGQPRRAAADRDQLERAETVVARRPQRMRGGPTSSTSSPTTTPAPQAVHGRLGPGSSSSGPRRRVALPRRPRPPLPRASVREHDLAWIWSRRPCSRVPGTDWMPEPCASRERREVDLGGCRCQAFQLTGDASRTDPVFVLSPDRRLIDEAVAAATTPTPPPRPARPGARARADAGAGVAAPPRD